MSAPSPAANRGRLWPFLVLGSLLLYWWLASAGHWSMLPNYTLLYSEQARALSQGYAHLLIAPDPRLLALPDPYDSVRDAYFKINDASLYHDRYYIYFGVVPALLGAVANWLGMGFPSDALLGLAGAMGLLLVLVPLVLLLTRDRPELTALGVALVAWQTPLMFCMGRPAVYESAIIYGQLFLMGSLCLLLLLPQVGNSWRSWLCVAAGLAAGCATGSRISLAPASVSLGICCWWLCHRRPRELASFWLGLCIVASLLGAFNAARFGSPLETGARYALTMGRGLMDRFSPSHIVPNLIEYTLVLPQLSRSFPPIQSGQQWLHFKNHDIDKMIGELWATPLLLWGLWLVRRIDATTATLIVLTLVTPAPALLLSHATERYSLDFTPSLSLLALVGLTRGLRSRGLRRIAWVCCGWSLLVGTCFGIVGYFGQFQLWNPALFSTMQRAF